MKKVVNVSGRRKTAIAKATVQSGKGNVRVNGIAIHLVEPRYIQMKIQEPVTLAQKQIKSLDISVTVRGGGQSGQADAIRLAISRGIVEYTENEELKNALLAYDRHLLVADIRRKESSKPNCRGKARAKRQKSYR